MSMSRLVLPRRELRFPARRESAGHLRRRVQALFGLCALPFILLYAQSAGTPGMRLRWRCVALAFRAAAKSDYRRAYNLLANPMDSFRYFELDYVERNIGQLPLTTYLDVSSPRLVALSIVDQHPGLVVDLVNPIASDMDETIALATALGLQTSLRPLCALVDDCGYAAESFDLITCISVMEHIPDDRSAVQTIWNLLKPGGRFILTTPCARLAVDEYTNLDEYELFSKEQDGLVFWQRYYDAALMDDVFFAVMGKPDNVAIYGERRAGAYDDNVFQKRVNPDYPYWREPLMMAREFRYYAQIDDLPGMGVIGMTFIKPARS